MPEPQLPEKQFLLSTEVVEAGARGAGRDPTSPAGDVEDQGTLLDIVLSRQETGNLLHEEPSAEGYGCGGSII